MDAHEDIGLHPMRAPFLNCGQVLLGAILGWAPALGTSHVLLIISANVFIRFAFDAGLEAGVTNLAQSIPSTMKARSHFRLEDNCLTFATKTDLSMYRALVPHDTAIT